MKKLTAEEFAGAERETELGNGLRLNLGEFDSSHGWRQLLAFGYRCRMLLLRGDTQMVPWLTPLCHWSDRRSKVGMRRRHAVNDQPLVSGRVLVRGPNKCRCTIIPRGIIVLTLIGVQPSPSSPFILQNTHRHMRSHARTHAGKHAGCQ